MKGKFSDTIKEYVRKLADDDIRLLHMRLSQRLGSDLAEAIEFMQKNPEVDYWLSASKNADDLYDMVDAIDHLVQNETKRRFSQR